MTFVPPTEPVLQCDRSGAVGLENFVERLLKIREILARPVHAMDHWPEAVARQHEHSGIRRRRLQRGGQGRHERSGAHLRVLPLN
jgi:hypothetical protein